MGFTSSRSTPASRAGFCSRSPPLAPASRWPSRSSRWAKSSRCRPTTSTCATKSSRTSGRSTTRVSTPEEGSGGGPVPHLVELPKLIREPAGEPEGGLVLLHGRATDERDLYPLLEELDPDQK